MPKLLKLISTFLQVFTYEFNIILTFLQLFVLYFNIISIFLQFSVYNFNIISTILYFYNCRNYLISTDNFKCNWFKFNKTIKGNYATLCINITQSKLRLKIKLYT